MKVWRAIYAMNLLFSIGCGQLRPKSSPEIVGQRIVTDSGNDPFVDMEDGTRIGVDGVHLGQSMEFKLTQDRDNNGKIVVGVDAVSDPMSEPEQHYSSDVYEILEQPL